MTRAIDPGLVWGSRMASATVPPIPPPPPLPKVSATADAEVTEGSDITFVFTRIAPYIGESSVHWAITDSDDVNLDVELPYSGTITFPAGSALPRRLIVSTKVRLDLQGSRVLTLTLSAPVNCEITTTTVNVLLKDDVVAPPVDLPVALLTINIANNSELSKINGSTVVAGTHYLLASGTYSSNINLSKNVGTSTNPVVIRPATGVPGNAVKLTGTLTLSAPFSWAYGLDFSGGNRKVSIATRDCRVGRCYFHDTDVEGIVSISNSAARTRIDHCSFLNFKREAIEHNVNFNATNSQNVLIERCLFKNHSYRSTDNESVWRALTDTFRKHLGTMRFCRFDNCMKRITTGNQQEILSCKTSWWTFENLTFVNMGGPARVTLREADHCTFKNCWLDSSCYIFILGEFHTVENCRAPDNSKVVMINAGNADRQDPTPSVCTGYSKNGATTIVNKGTSSNPKCDTAMARCSNTLIKNCRGQIVFDGSDTIGYINTTLDACDQHPIYNSTHWEAPTETNFGTDNVTATELPEDEVGPLYEL